MVQKLMSQYQQVNKELINKNNNVDNFIQTIEKETKKTNTASKQKPEENKKEDSRWKQKFIKIWQAGE